MNVNENISKNIVNLRKANNLTQLDLANKLNYSDKAVSKWERGDSVPDIEMLYKIATLFNVDVNYLINEHNTYQVNNNKNKKNLFVRKLLLNIFTCSTIFLVATIIFLIGVIRNPNNSKTMWLAFMCATPICALINAIYAKKEKYWLMQLLSCSMIIWTVIATVYCFAIVLNIENFWLIFIAGVPIQAVVCLYFFFKKTF